MLTEQEKKKLDKQFKLFKRKWFTGKQGFSGQELEDCKKAFCEKKGIPYAS